MKGSTIAVHQVRDNMDGHRLLITELWKDGLDRGNNT